MSSRSQACKCDKCLKEILDVVTSPWSPWSHNWTSASSGFCKPACCATVVIDWWWWWSGGWRRWAWCSSYVISTGVCMCGSWRVRRRGRRPHWWGYRRYWNWRWRRDWCHIWRWRRRRWRRRRRRRRCRRRWRRRWSSISEWPRTVDNTHGLGSKEREKRWWHIKTTGGASRTLDSGLIYNLSMERKCTDGIFDSCCRGFSIICYGDCFKAKGSLHLLQERLDEWPE